MSTHFNHPNEVSASTRNAMKVLMDGHLIVRNQSVLLRGVNDDVDTMRRLIRALGAIQIHPYYVYMCDMVRGVEGLRTSLARAIELEKQIRGCTAGFNTPTWIVDMPRGGGKRDIHSFEVYDREAGISVFTAPTVKPGRRFYYFDPLRELSAEARRHWDDPQLRRGMIRGAALRAKEAVR